MKTETTSDLLTDAQLGVWASALVADLQATGLAADDRPSELRRGKRRAYRDEPSGPHLAVEFETPNWVRGSKVGIELYPDGRSRWRGAEATVRELYLHLNSRCPRWRVPPEGGPAWAVTLTERNGWEGESWCFSFPLTPASEAAALELMRLHRPSRGTDMRLTPFCPQSMARFGSWSLGLSYQRAVDAQRRAETSPCGYMNRFNWSEAAGEVLAGVLRAARETDVLRWCEDSSGPGVLVWKGRVSVQDINGRNIAETDLT